MALFFRWLWYLLPANPVLVHIVQLGSRLGRHLWARMGYLGVLIGLMVVGLLAGGGFGGQVGLTDLAKAGTRVFVMVSYGQVVLICLLAPLFTAGVIAQQQAGRTYDILLTTPLSSLQIILGVLLGRLFFILALLASGVPLFAVLLIFGGVPVWSVFVSFAVAGLSAIVVGSVAVALSVWRTGGRNAVLVFIITVGLYLVAIYLADAFVLRGGAGGMTWLTPLHPLLVLEASLHGVGYRSLDVVAASHDPAWARFYFSHPFAVFALVSTVVSSTLIITSAVCLRRAGRNQSRASWWVRLHRRWGWRGSVDVEGLTRRTPQTVWANPVAWREAQTRSNRGFWFLMRWGFALVGLGVGMGLLVMYHYGHMPAIPAPGGDRALEPHEVFRRVLEILLMLETMVIVMIALYLSAGCVSREREEGTLELLLTTPITPRQYLWGKLRGLVSYLMLPLAVPVLTLAVVSSYTLIGRYLQWSTAVVPHHTINAQGHLATTRVLLLLPEAPLLLALMLVPFVGLCVAVGMWWSLKSKSVLGAVTPALGIVACLVWVAGVCGLSAVQNAPLIGPVINALSPATNLLMVIDPWTHIVGFGEAPTPARQSIALGALLAAGGYGTVVYLMLLTMVNSFGQTVRKR